MVHRAHDVKVNRWTAFFFACRTALRTQAGTSAAEFLLPILIVDRLCFGNGKDQTSLHSELRDVLTFDGSSTKAIRMPLSDRRRAVNLVFSILDLLQHWVDPEQEAKHNRRSRSHGSNHVGDRAEKTSIVLDWSQCEASMRIEGLQEAIPLSLRAHAAACVGMHASALRYLEMGSRLEVVDKVFGSAALDLDIRSQNRSRAAGKCNNSERSLMKDVLASLNDVETMTAFTDDDVLASPLTRTKDGIRQKVALEDWQGAWQDYESSRQLLRNDPSSDLGILRCLIELGHYDSVLQHVSTTIKCDTLDDASLDAIPFAIEAARRLGRWDKLTELTECVKNKQLEPYTLFQVEVSRAMLGGRERSFSSVLSSLRTSRCAVMDGLSNAARESYIRAYDHVLQLQSLREIEDVSMWMCSKSNEATSLEAFTEEAGLCWSRRLGAVSSSGSNSVISARMSLARLAGDSVYEGSLFLCMGKKARKRGLYSAASNLFAQAETALRCVESLKKVNLSSMLRLQCAKLKHAIGESTIALRILGLDDIETMGSMDDNELREASLHRIFSTLGIQKNSMDDQSAVLEFVRSALQSTRWMIEGGLKGSVEVIARFRIIHRLAPNFEKG